MSIENIKSRANNCCELCESTDGLEVYEVFVSNDDSGKVLLCKDCKESIENQDFKNRDWNCLNNSMWSEVSGVKVLSYWILKDIGRNDLVDMIYLDENEQKIAQQKKEVLKDSNGNVLKDGDSVTLIKDLEVKGAGKTIKRGTNIKNIRLCDVDGHISCKVDGIGQVYLKVEFLKKI